jgi:AcrR family transcriptional regulator
MINELIKEFPTKKKQILETAEDLFLRFGIKRISIEEICSTSKVSKMTFYKYFKNKNDLVKYLWSIMFDFGMKKFEEIESMNISFQEKVALILKLKEESSKKLSHEFAIEYFFANTELREFFDQMYQKSITSFINFIKNAQSKGEVRAEMNPEFFFAATNKMMELVENKQLVQSYKSYKDFVMEVNNFLFYGIFPRVENN